MKRSRWPDPAVRGGSSRGGWRDARPDLALPPRERVNSALDANSNIKFEAVIK